MRPLTGTELGMSLGGLSETVIRQKERAGELFSVVRPHRRKERAYPVFQTWPDIAGDTLAQVLRALGDLDATDIYGFFAVENDLIGDLTPVEALIGRCCRSRTLEKQTQDFLASPTPVRLDAVLKAAAALVSLRAAS
jgi:hypothetical protein